MALSMIEKSTKTGERQYYLLALRIASDFGASIAVPIITFVLAGRWLDAKYDRGILFTVGGFVLAAIISGRIIYKKAGRYGREYQALVDQK